MDEEDWFDQEECILCQGMGCDDCDPHRLLDDNYYEDGFEEDK